MKNFKLYFLIVFITISITSFAQIGIGTNTPDPSALLDLNSTSKGLLMPRMTTLQQTNLVRPAIGLTIYNTTTSQIETNKGDGLGGALWTSASTTGTTALPGTNTNQLATTAFVLANNFGSYASVNEIVPISTTSLIFFNIV